MRRYSSSSSSRIEFSIYLSIYQGDFSPLGAFIGRHAGRMGDDIHGSGYNRPGLPKSSLLGLSD